ncbi:bifunctional 4-hydroxy-2-oxoglutarate aldolase/2-dehydro-3-deoxy-phosphogluconate aldolase [Rossellomorea sp. NPDC077527]|uniref:bifunctional 4-hydroxy-2-oxoglutarate aldolase/2-dehydro-3-deoxy-phosphogluconate aldolase n=1 Tax=Rossellomorea sp. NPDC077527 TaxID=3364510 RepID=UPI0037C8D710
MKKWDIENAIHTHKMIAVIRSDSEDEAYEMARLSVEGGIRLIEVTATTPGFLNIIKKIRKEQPKHVIVGAGTILDPTSARMSIMEGAEFIVCPHYEKEIIELCHLYQVLIIPGAATVESAVLCLKAGCSFIKLFPGSIFQPSDIKSFKGPLPQAKFIPTGGVGKVNIRDWLEEGAAAVGVGSELKRVYQKEKHGFADYIVSLVERAGVRSPV